MSLQRKVPKGARAISASLLGVTYGYPTVIYSNYPDAIELQHFCMEFRTNAKRMSQAKLVAWALKEIG